MRGFLTFSACILLFFGCTNIQITTEEQIEENPNGNSTPNTPDQDPDNPPNDYSIDVSVISNLNITGSDDPDFKIGYNGKVYFSAVDNNMKRKLYNYDPSTGTVIQVANTNQDPLGDQNDDPFGFVEYNGMLYFSSQIAIGVSKLHSFDDQELVNLNIDSNITIDSIVYSGKLFFSSGKKLSAYYFDEASQSYITEQINDTLEYPRLFVIYDDILYFVANESRNVIKLYSYNGASIKNIGAEMYNGDKDQTPVVHKGKLYIPIKLEADSVKLFSYDGVSLEQVANINPAGSDRISNLKEYNNALYFSAMNEAEAISLYKYDGTSIERISNIREDGYDAPSLLTVFKDKLFFIANSNEGTKLFLYDSQKSELKMAISLNESPLGDNISSVGVYGDYLYFSASANEDWNKLYRLSLD